MEQQYSEDLFVTNDSSPLNIKIDSQFPTKEQQTGCCILPQLSRIEEPEELSQTTKRTGQFGSLSLTLEQEEDLFKWLKQYKIFQKMTINKTCYWMIRPRNSVTIISIDVFPLHLVMNCALSYSFSYMSFISW